MVPCCSHTGWRTAMQVMEHVGGPVIFSHSNSHALHAHPRNIPDERVARALIADLSRLVWEHVAGPAS